jgi:hypothetical protein
VSFTADATPCHSSATALTIADVVGAVHIPIPVARITVGQKNSRCVEFGSSPYMQAKPTAISSVPWNSARRSPGLGTYHNDNAERIPSGTMNGPKEMTAASGE